MGQCISDYLKDSREEDKELFQVLEEMANSIMQARSEIMRHDAVADNNLPLVSIAQSRKFCFVNAKSGVCDRVSEAVGSLFDGRFMGGFKSAVTAALDIFLSNFNAVQQELTETYVVFDRRALVRINLYYYKHQLYFEGDQRNRAQNLFCYTVQIGLLDKLAANSMIVLYQISKNAGMRTQVFMDNVMTECIKWCKTETHKLLDVTASKSKDAATDINEGICSSTIMSTFEATPQYLRIAKHRKGINADTCPPLYVWRPASIWIQHVQDRKQEDKDFYKNLNEKKTAVLLITVSMILLKVLKEKRTTFKEEEFAAMRELSGENQTIFDTFFIKKQTDGKLPIQFEHTTLREYFVAAYCKLNRIEVLDALRYKLNQVIRLIGGLTATKESQDDEDFIKMYMECLENAHEKEEKSTEVVKFFKSTVSYLENLSKGRGKFAQHCALRLLHVTLENASFKSKRAMAELNVDFIALFQKLACGLVIIYPAMSQVEVNNVVHFIQSLFSSRLESKLNEMTFTIWFAKLKDDEIIRTLFKSILFFRNAWLSHCELSSFPWEMMKECGSPPEDSKLENLYINSCEMLDAECMQLVNMIPFSKEVELVGLKLSDANCQEMINAIAKEHSEGKAKLRELKMNYCNVKGSLRKKFMNLKKVHVHITE